MPGIVIPSFLLGLLTTTSPCILPLYPGFLAYLSGQSELGLGKQRYLLGFFVLAGVLTMMLALGALIAVLTVPIGSVLVYVIPISDLLILALGIMLLVDRNPFNTLPQIQLPALRHAYINAYAYGLLYGPIAIPCSGPLIVSIFALSLTAGEAVGRLWGFLWFGIGLGLPLLILSLLSGVYQHQLTVLFSRYSRVINIGGGLLLVGIAVYDLSKNWTLMRLFLT
jgi:cytochrome c-type biogenesis protein